MILHKSKKYISCKPLHAFMIRYGQIRLMVEITNKSKIVQQVNVQKTRSQDDNIVVENYEVIIQLL